MSARERTGWRCEDISRRHREWGFNCPAVDLDFLMVEYNLGAPVALVEYKHHKVTYPVNLNHATYRAIHALADIAQVPFFLSFYWPETWAFYVVPVNARAQEVYCDEARRMLTEQRYVKSLYFLRQQVIQSRVLERLSAVELPANTVLPTIILPKEAA